MCRSSRCSCPDDSGGIWPARCEAAVRGDVSQARPRPRTRRLTSASGRPLHGGYAGTAILGQVTVYLDHAATTPMHPAAIEAMTAVLATVGNASSLHGTGRVARRRMEEARESLAHLLGARPSEVIFTAGGTESDNLAVKGIYWARRDADRRSGAGSSPPRSSTTRCWTRWSGSPNTKAPR